MIEILSNIREHHVHSKQFMHVLFLHVFCDFRLIRTVFTAKKAHRLYRHLLLNAARRHGNARVGLYFMIRLYMVVQASFRGEAFGT